jgi:pimeloyl-ACP methyl ester carboxylesterase
MAAFKFASLVALLLLAAAARGDDRKLDAVGLIESRGFQAETHFVTTEDSYILQLFRIPPIRSGARVVLLQHGLLDSADTWLVNERNVSLAYVLADAGCDVWLGNSRGNKYSTNSTRLDPKHTAFWNFSWDDMARVDTPAQIAYILNVTGAASLAYVGHSQGTTIMFANLATPAWSVGGKVDVFIALAPVAYVHNTKSALLRLLADLQVDDLLPLFGPSFLPSTALLRTLLPAVCEAAPHLCDDVIGMIAGFDQSDLDQARLPIYVAHFPSGTSDVNVHHWLNGVRAEQFCQLAGHPCYNVSAIADAKIALFWGGKDDLADTTDVARLLQQLDPSVVVYQQFNASLAHLDYVWGATVYESVYPYVLQLIQE